MKDAEARYQINAVSDLTGVPPATLRAWERRYGVPTPSRTSTLYRLYSQRDVERVKRMQALVDEGVAPSQAAKEVLSAASDEPTVEVLESSEAAYRAAIARIVKAATEMDTVEMQSALGRTLLMEPGLTVFARVLRPAMVEIGALWHAGKLSVASEHLATHAIAATVWDLVRTTSVPAGAPVVLLACFPEEQHLLPIHGVALELATWGYRPVVLGARTPLTAVARAIETISPALVGLSTTVPPASLGEGRDLVDAYGDICRNVPWLVGGRAANELEPFIVARGGHRAPDNAEAARKLVDQLVRRGRRDREPTGTSRKKRPIKARRRT